MVAAVYVRVSTDQQAEDGYSLAEQERLCKTTVEGHEWTLGKVYRDDGYSGKTLDRPALKELMEDIRLGVVDAVIVYKLDRLSRSLKDTMTIIEDVLLPNDVHLVSLKETLDTSTPWGRAMIGILASFNQLDRETIVQRTTMGKKAKAAKGGFLGGNTPYGYAVAQKKLEVVEDEARVVRQIFDMTDSGMSLRAIADALAFKGVKNRHGSPMTYPTIHTIVKNRDIYLGINHGVKNAHPAILEGK